MGYERKNIHVAWWCVLILIFAFTSVASALVIDLAPPGDREFILDSANLISATDTQAIRELCDMLLTDTATPIIVVTINSMSAHGGADLRIETFAHLLFDQWGIGHETINGKPLNTGILLLVSKNDRKARIQLGAGWGHRENSACQQIMDDYIIPQFKRQQFSAGILAGVQALDKLARKQELPQTSSQNSTQNIPSSWIGNFFSGILSFILWPIALIAGLFMRARGGGGGGGGGFSGGSFGGGFSGGGGASGSW